MFENVFSEKWSFSDLQNFMGTEIIWKVNSWLKLFFTSKPRIIEPNDWPARVKIGHVLASTSHRHFSGTIWTSGTSILNRDFARSKITFPSTPSPLYTIISYVGYSRDNAVTRVVREPGFPSPALDESVFISVIWPRMGYITYVITYYICDYILHMWLHNIYVITYYICDYILHIWLHITYVITYYICDYILHMWLHITYVITYYICDMSKWSWTRPFWKIIWLGPHMSHPGSYYAK